MSGSQRAAASTPVGGWEDISTAPKDGTPVLLWHDHAGVTPHAVIGKWVEDGLWDVPFHDDWFAEKVFSHWQQIAPPPPSVSTGSRPQEAVPTEQAAPPVLADERLIWFLRVIEGAGGEAPAGDGYNVLGAFCDDRGDDDDTYNVSESLGYTRTMHSGWGDGCASVSITDAGRAVLSAPAPQPADGCSSNEGAALWAMHLRGPDDIYPAPDHETAQNWCDYVNDFVAQVGSDVEVVAAPVHWSGTAEAHAEGLPLAVAGWTLPDGHPAITILPQTEKGS